MFSMVCAKPSEAGGFLVCLLRLEDFQHQVQSNCLELAISLSDGDDYPQTASLSVGTGQARPFRPRGGSLCRDPARAVDADPRLRAHAWCRGGRAPSE